MDPWKQASIETFSDDDLIVELMGRFDHCVISGLKTVSDQTQEITRRWKGNSFTVYGLAVACGQAAHDDFVERSTRKE